MWSPNGSPKNVVAAFLVAVVTVAGGGFVTPCAASSPNAPSEGLEHYWALDEAAGTTAADSVGGQPGTLSGGPIWQPASGQFGGALAYDGVDDRVELGTIDVPPGGGMSITLWIKADDFDVPDGRLISKATGIQEGDHYWMVSTINSTGLRFRLKAGGTTTTLATGAGEITAGAWHHVAVTYDGSDMRIYRDGVEVASAPKAGSIDTNAGVAVAMGNQPAGAGSKAFDGLLDDVRIYDRPLTPAEISGMSPPKPALPVTLWYGDVLDIGHLGTPQQWVNILGNVSPAGQVDSLLYAVNGGPESELNLGPDGFRLLESGDFNIEISYDDLLPGANDVVITVVDNQGQRADTTVTVNYTSGVGYDRLLAAGQRHWASEFEVLCPMTIHDFETTFPDGGPAIGVLFGWQGHDGTGQPHYGHPYQSIGFIRGLASSPYLQLMRNGDVGVATTPATINVGTRYLMRIRSRTISATMSRVRMRVWEDGTSEPGSWDLVADFVTRGGSIVLVAHRADVTFGDTTIEPIGTPIAVRPTPPVGLTVLPNAPNPFGGSTTIGIGLSSPAPVEMEVFDVLGRRVYHRSMSLPSAGIHRLRFDALDSHGSALPSGVYFYRVRALGQVATRKMVISR
jgi:hypothetical protein